MKFEFDKVTEDSIEFGGVVYKLSEGKMRVRGKTLSLDIKKKSGLKIKMDVKLGATSAKEAKRLVEKFSGTGVWK